VKCGADGFVAIENHRRTEDPLRWNGNTGQKITDGHIANELIGRRFGPQQQAYITCDGIAKHR